MSICYDEYSFELKKRIEDRLFITEFVDSIIEACYSERFRTGEWVNINDIISYVGNKILDLTTKTLILWTFYNRIRRENRDIDYKTDVIEEFITHIKVTPKVHTYDNYRRTGLSSRIRNRYIREILCSPNKFISIYDLAYNEYGPFHNRQMDVFLAKSIMDRFKLEWNKIINVDDIHLSSSSIMFKPINSSKPKDDTCKLIYAPYLPMPTLEYNGIITNSKYAIVDAGFYPGIKNISLVVDPIYTQQQPNNNEWEMMI